jgi:hypothetical protein
MKAFPRDLTDTALRDEIELVAELVVVASSTTARLSEAEIDAILGLAGAHRLSA